MTHRVWFHYWIAAVCFILNAGCTVEIGDGGGELGRVEVVTHSSESPSAHRLEWAYPTPFRAHAIEFGASASFWELHDAELEEFYTDLRSLETTGWDGRTSCANLRCVYEGLIRSNQAALIPLAQRLREHALLSGHDRLDLISEIVALVQNIPYSYLHDKPFGLLSPVDVI